MKRIKAACVQQTIHFMLKEDTGHASAARAVREELEAYKTQLEKHHTKYQIIEETLQPDDSVIIKIKKQLSNYDYGEYFKE